MPTIYSNQYQDAFIDVPSNKIKRGDQSGEVKHLFFDYQVTAAPANGDVLKLGKLPKGARVVEACLSFPDLGTAGSLNMGWAASAELIVDSVTPVEAADADGFLAAVDVATAADTVLMSSGANLAGLGKAFDAEVDVQIDIATAWTATSGTIKGYLTYVVY
jgi:hypothetical protein